MANATTEAMIGITGPSGTVNCAGATGPPGMPSGLGDAVTKLRSLKAVGVVRFDKNDVVRHPLVSEIIHAYETAARPNAKITEEASRPPGGEAEHASNGQRQ